MSMPTNRSWSRPLSLLERELGGRLLWLLWLSNDRQTQQGKLLEHRPSLSKYPMVVNDLSVLE